MQAGKIPFEQRRLDERLHALRLAIWLALDLESRLRFAWYARAIRYNHMRKDFPSAPVWYRRLTAAFSNWRNMPVPKRPVAARARHVSRG